MANNRAEMMNQIRQGSTTADLANESRPVPEVQATMTWEDYSRKAKELIDKLNADRRRAGGYLPDDAARMREINLLLETANRLRNNPSAPPPARQTPNSQSGRRTPTPPGMDEDTWYRQMQDARQQQMDAKATGRPLFDPPASTGVDQNDAAATTVTPDPPVRDKPAGRVPATAPIDQEIRWRMLKFGMSYGEAKQSIADDRARAENRWAETEARYARRDAELDAVYNTPAPDMSSTDVLPGDKPGTVRKWNNTTGRYDTVPAPAAGSSGTPVSYGRRVPAAGRVDGGRNEAPQEFASQQEADEYNVRAAKDGVPTPMDEYEPSQRDTDMMARGFVPVYGRDGSVVYMRAAPDSGVGSPNRAGQRGGLLEASPGGHPMYEQITVPGPLGRQRVYRASDEFKQENRDNVQARSAARAERDAQRQQMVVAQAQATQRPMNYLNNPNVDPWAKRVMAEALLRSGHPGATPLDVQGLNLEAAQRLANNAQIGAAGLAGQQAEFMERQRRDEQEQSWRQKGHTAANRWGQWNTPEARRAAFIDAARAAGAPEAWVQAEADAAYPLVDDGRGPGRGDGRGLPEAGGPPPAPIPIPPH